MISIDGSDLNFELLDKGDYIRPEELLGLFRLWLADEIESEDGVLQTHPISIESDKFSLCLLNLAERARTARPDLAAHIRTRRHGLLVMTDDEAERYGWDRPKQLVRQIGTITMRRSSIDRNALTEERRAEADCHDKVLTGLALMARKELREAGVRALMAKGDKK